MSPMLQQVAPAGSIEIKLIEPKAVSKIRVRRMNDIAVVTRAQAFTSAAAKLASASDRLDTEAQHQSKYWEQLASLRSNGWLVSRVPNDTKALVVHFGSAEAAPQYRNRAVAALRQDENGDLTLPGQIQVRRPKILSVTIHRRGRVTGRSILERENTSARTHLEDKLVQAQEALFQEELFNEASKEARLLANMGVKARSSSIEFSVSDQCSVAVSYAKQPLERPPESQVDDELAEFVGNGLRLMLVAEHQQRHLQRAEHKPPPMSQNPRSAAEYALLRPVISLLRHHSEISPLLGTVENYKASLQLAGLHLSVEHQSSAHTGLPPFAVQALRRVVVSQTIIALPSQESVSIKVETHLAAPWFGTQFSSMQYSGPCGSSSCAGTSSSKDAVRFLEDVLCRDICTLILRSQEGPDRLRLKSDNPPELLLADGNDALATLAVTCSGARVAISCKGLKGSSKEVAQWNKRGFRITDEDGQLEGTEQGLLEIVRSWVGKLTA